jgi:hypothetical protein
LAKQASDRIHRFYHPMFVFSKAGSTGRRTERQAGIS